MDPYSMFAQSKPRGALAGRIRAIQTYDFSWSAFPVSAEFPSLIVFVQTCTRLPNAPKAVLFVAAKNCYVRTSAGQRDESGCDV